jgi:release factor glutamine methyltransferase
MISRLQVEVAIHDPHIALDGGADGLDAHRAIFADLDRLMERGGRGFVEVGRGQAAKVAALAEREGFSTIFHRDLGGIERVAEFHRAVEDGDADAEGDPGVLKNGLGKRAPNG